MDEGGVNRGDPAGYSFFASASLWPNGRRNWYIAFVVRLWSCRAVSFIVGEVVGEPAAMVCGLCESRHKGVGISKNVSETEVIGNS